MKKFIKFGILLSATAAVCACSAEEYLEDDPVPGEEEAMIREHSYVPGVSVVEFDESTAARVEAGDESLLKNMGIVSAERVFKDGGEFEPLARREGLHRFYRVTFAKVMPVTKAMASFTENSGVLGVDPVRKIRRRAFFNDPYLSSQWNLVSSRSGVDVNVQDVWKNYTTGSSNVIVSVVDEAIDMSHPDLAANIWESDSGYNGYNAITGTNTLSLSRRYDTGHGTHVAGVISAVNNNGVGVSSIAGGDYAKGIKGVRLMSCQIFYGEDSATDDQCAEAIRWSATHGAVISQNSWGYYADEDDDGYVSSSELTAYKKEKIAESLKRAIAYFTSYAGCDASGKQLASSPMKGGLVFFAAGNEDIDYDPICADDNVIAIGATDGRGGKASYSNYGSWVDICAPGGDGSSYITSTLPTFVASAGYGGRDWMGTSMACPHVSGVAALAVSYYGGQGFTSAKLRKALLQSSREVTTSNPIGKMIDAEALFVALDNHPPVVSKAIEDFKHNSLGTVSRPLNQVFNDEDGDALTYTAVSSDETVAGVHINSGHLYIDPASYGWCVITVTASDGIFEPVSTSFKVAIWDPSSGVSATGNVSDGNLTLTIGEEEYQDVHVEVLSSTGAVVYEKWVAISVFDPVTLNISGIAPGVYAVRVTYAGHSYTRTFVKS